MSIEKVLIVGAGYVGTSIAVLLSQKHEVLVVDQDIERVEMLLNFESPVTDSLISEYFAEKSLNINAEKSISKSINNFDIAILALPTNYNPDTNYFDTSIIEQVISEIYEFNSNIPIIIKSTVPIGFTKKIQGQYPKNKIIFSPEFLREGHALYDNLYPSRIVIGDKGAIGKLFGDLLYAFAKNNPDILFMESSEAEAVKLFANTYLATRVTFFNELDSFCLNQNLCTKSVINGISSDPRIGNGYNNPSFGYGGYCLPKDTKQLLANFESIPQGIFTAVVDGNTKRKQFVADQVLSLKPKVLGIYRLTMKEGSDNFRESAIFDVIKIIKSKGTKIYIYEPLIGGDKFDGFKILQSLEEFKASCELILANRMHEDIIDISEKVFTRDIFGEN